MKLKHSLLVLLAAAIPFVGYSKMLFPLVGMKPSSGSEGSSSSTSGGKAFSYGDVYLEPDDGLAFSISDIADEIGGGTVLSEFLPTGIAVTWTGKKFKVPKAGKVKYSKREGDFIATQDDNPCSFKISISKKTGKVKGSFKVYVAVGDTKVKAYTAKFSGSLGGEISVSIKKIGVSATASLE